MFLFYFDMMRGLILFTLLNLTYKYVVAFLLGLSVMSIQDSLCLYDSDLAVCNCATVLILEKLTYDEIKDQIVNRIMRNLRRMRQKIVYVFGDPYLKDVPIEEASKLVYHRKEPVHSEEEIVKFMEFILPSRICLQKPPWEVHVFPDYNDTESAVILKIHHSIGDGLSGQFAALTSSDHFDPENAPPIRNVTNKERFLLTCLGFLRLPWALFKSMYYWAAPNPLNYSPQLSGKKVCEVSKDYILEDIKAASKLSNVTINDYISSVLGVTVYKYFNKQNFKTDEVVVSIPINIRYYKPQTIEEIQIDNKFTVELVKLPVMRDFDATLKTVHDLFQKLKSSSDSFSIYMISLILGSMVPFQLTQKLIYDITKQITFVFTNLPGPQMPIYFKGRASKKAWIHFIPAGQCGVSLGLYSHNGIVKLGTCVDDATMKDSKQFLKLFEETLDEVLMNKQV
ncbi:ws dgat mgat [Stylonychia lemnae]|uniref:Ws dgat mgat n=1 Tax=Stylonychia lemnae TaxID=5949 RepID=A0A077ZZV5_STYLE|nr:ws dgat mgat [Stylonychia lemnae]|eukprot:CDW75466.1 ws dgat mgat [Stylonychia lemnae]